ncbi:TRAP transporter fused permease subunit [Fluviibacterium sp. DFM31]|uniref:TRAP transporter fused permease subunit n=1 Tax=Meridianimarinicoccus marinus TaxID=3231483 RepID=A0ABV3LD72_9RHOB
MATIAETKSRTRNLLFILSLVLVAIGMLNSTPGIPGWDSLAQSLFGMRARSFPTEWLFPLVFALFMIIVAMDNSIGRSWSTRGRGWQAMGYTIDILLVVAAFAISASFLVENNAICLIDQVTGERARLITEALAKEAEYAAMMGLPEPTVVDNPMCQATTGPWLPLIVGFAVVIFLGYNVKVWGFPLVFVAILVAAYTILTVVVWYFYGADDINKYLVTKVGGEPRSWSDLRPKVQDILVNQGSGLLGQFMSVILNTVFPYIVLGGLFGASAGGQTLIKLAFRWTRHLRGGPAHAAIVSSSLFGTISGGPVVNVLSTGRLTIPMMIKSGFSPTFAGGVEAAASSGGSIMPPVMGVAAFLVAALTATPYSDVIIAAILPALAYFLCLFLSVMFQARRQNIHAVGSLTEDMRMSREDPIHLLQIFLPILLIFVVLLSSKESVGCGWLGALLGAERTVVDGTCRATDLPWILHLFRNSIGDAGSAGWWATVLLAALLFLDRTVRKSPWLLLDALSDAGRTIAKLYLMFLAVSIIDFCLNFTGLARFVAIDILTLLDGLDLGAGGSQVLTLLALFVTMCLAVILGMGMPSVPAYINVALLMGPLLSGLGIATFTAHMFVFYFAVASAITPPVAIAAFAAASITKADPLASGFSAVRSGVVMFVIPFIFAMYPELLIVDAAIIDPASSIGDTGAYLSGYDGTLHVGALALLLLRVVFALFILASALARFDASRLAGWEVVLRLILAAAIMHMSPMVWGAAVLIAIGVLVFHRLSARNAAARETPDPDAPRSA